jgi:hypothetical protein
MDAARDPENPRLETLVEGLSQEDPDFRRWWAAQHVTAATGGTKILHHPDIGELVLDWNILVCPSDPDQRLVIMTAEPGTPSHDALRTLAAAGVGEFTSQVAR